jgi:DNA polymerase alpha subunit A
MAVPTNNSNKNKQNLKPKENADKFMKNLLSELEDDQPDEKFSSSGNKRLNLNNNSNTIISNHSNNHNSSQNSGFNFSHLNTRNKNIPGINPNFLPEFERKLTTKENIEELPFEASFSTDSKNPPGREVVTNKNNIINSAGHSAVKRNLEDVKISASKQNHTTNDIFQNRTPVTQNKTITNINNNSEKSQYYTPNSKLLEGRTPIQQENFATPTRPTFTENKESMSGIVYNINNDINSSDISMRTSLKEKLPTSSDGSLSVYWYDAIEDQIQTKPVVIFFGKIYDPSVKSFVSISLVVKNIMRTLYIYPKISDLLAVYKEFENLRSTKFSYIRDYMSKTEKKKYCFELPIPHGEHEVIKIKYQAEQGTIPSNLQGETFDYIFGKNSSLLEKILLSRKVKGPCWLKIRNFEQPTSQKNTYSKYEVIINDYKNIDVETVFIPNPPLKLLSVSLLTFNNHGTNEIFAISAAMKDNYYVENEQGTNQNSDFSPLVILRRFDQSLFVHTKDLAQENQINLRIEDYEIFKEKFGVNNFLMGQNETAIINQFLNRLANFDPDIIIGHNLYTGAMELLFNRITKLKINNWAKIGKFRRDVLPKFLQNSNLGNFYVRSCMVGRLICDTFLSCRDILKENNYNLSFLAEKHLKEKLLELDTNLVLSSSGPETILKDLDILLHNLLREAIATMTLMDKLAILPLTKQLTNIAGNLWIKSLQNSRADRCEMFLMHEFNKHGYLLPDKFNKSGEKFDDTLNEDKEEEAAPGKKKPQYSGGLVLEPKIGLYDSIVLLLDFNSLYPTIIQEFNICFTTVMRKPSQCFNYYEEKKNKKIAKKKEIDLTDKTDQTDQTEQTEVEPNEEESLDVKKLVTYEKGKGNKAILPIMLESLVEKRKLIKDIIKNEKDKFKLSMLDIKQKAIKLSANSLYGYLGYKNSRFYAKTIAALVTATGRSILQETVNLVTLKHQLDIIYGDTDSIMINTKQQDLDAALILGNAVKKDVKSKYNLLEMEVDGVFKTLLLLRKKKYAYLKYEAPYSVDSKLIAEYKGLDLVRRDWCEISKQTGLHILDIILSNRSKEDIINLIFESLKEIGHKMDTDKFILSDYEIRKQLTKHIDDYADAKALPHVKVAKRLREKGDHSFKQNAFVPYVICINTSDPDHSKSLSEKAYHTKELAENPNLKLDIVWYKENQIISSVSRLCKHIEEIDMYQLATQLGIDGSKYNYNINKNKENENTILLEQDEIVQAHCREGVSVTCLKCQKVIRINRIDKDNSLLKFFYCPEVIIYLFSSAKMFPKIMA